MFDKSNVNKIDAYIDTNREIKTASNGKSLYILCEPNTTYTISRTAGTRFRIIDTDVIPQIGVVGNQFIGTDTASTLTITTKTTSKYLCINYYNRNSDTITEQSILDSLQVEIGSVATTYEAYHDDYTDTIFTREGKWYKGSKIKRMLLDGSESGWKADSVNKLYGIATSPSALSNSSTSAIALGLTNYFIPQGLTYTRNHEGYFALYGPTTVNFWLNDLDKTLEDFKTWMGSHITTLYYVLATPTEEEITAPGLIAQLNALYQAM